MFIFNHLIFVILIILSVSEYSIIKAYRVFDVNGVETILALENEHVNIECKADMPMAYCGFAHPSGKRYSFLGDTLNAGHCYININATKEDVGEWRCHIGGAGAGLEIMKRIQLRIVNHLAAIQPNVSAVHRQTVTLSCITAVGMTSLSYCRFEPPDGQPFSINSEVTIDKPILNRFYFPNNRSLDRGDCAVTIRKVQYEDVGLWTCGAGFDDGKEHVDFIKVDVEGLYTMSTATAAGITVGVIGIFIALVILGTIAWKKRNMLGTSHEEREMEEIGEPQEVQSSQPGTPSLERRIPLVEESTEARRSRSRQGTPQMERVPLVTVQSPSLGSIAS